ncbi:hypothetical protein O6H91_16G083300 [Diphasiastrum complanatum]|uniref:Uncharacterized protein n=1 Tax=Diphasiastrum complanatum TaxID=34168 RepID=A0ACC2BEC1_DIPCM|nr:hypothetical protein O6H91_16G083300 [Diphasiastrum complanatum]
MQTSHSVCVTGWKGSEVVGWLSLRSQKRKHWHAEMWCNTPRINRNCSRVECILGSSLDMPRHHMLSGASYFVIPSVRLPTANCAGRRHDRAVISFIGSGTCGFCNNLQNKVCRRGVIAVGRPRPRSFWIAARKRDNEAERGSTFKRKPVSERSERVNEELLLFFFQLDLTTRLQRALNQDQYESAQQLREKIAEVEREILKQREAKMGSSSKDEAQDKEITILRLRTELQKAVEDEDYVGAADLRDKISQLEAESLAASAKALASKSVKYSFRLGQKVRHKDFGYRGVICGMDPLCCELEDWIRAAHIEHFVNGRNQPFYQVLVDVRQEPSLMVAYVAEEKLSALLEPDLERFDHPYVYFLFYGFDSAGDLIPTKQLREKYDTPRHELPWKEDGPEGSSGG